MKNSRLSSSSSFRSAALLLVIQFLLIGAVTAQDGKLKEAKGDDFNEKLEKRYPTEAKRGDDSIFRSVSKDRKDEKAEKKSDEKVEVKAEDTPEKSGWLGGLFKKKPETAEEAKDSEMTEKKDEAKPEKKTEKVVVKKDKKSDSDQIVATPMLEDDGETKSTLGGLFSGNLFGKKTEDETKPEKEKKKKEDDVIVEADSLTLKPAPKVEILTTQSGAGNGEGNFTSWDDVPYKRKSTVDRMMNKLNVREPATPAPRPLPTLPAPVIPAPAESAPEPKLDQPILPTAEKPKEDEPVRFKDN